MIEWPVFDLFEPNGLVDRAKLFKVLEGMGTERYRVCALALAQRILGIIQDPEMRVRARSLDCASRVGFSQQEIERNLCELENFFIVKREGGDAMWFSLDPNSDHPLFLAGRHGCKATGYVDRMSQPEIAMAYPIWHIVHQELKSPEEENFAQLVIVKSQYLQALHSLRAATEVLKGFGLNATEEMARPRLPE